MAKVKRAGSRLSSKHQVTLPVRVLRAAGLQAGDVLAVEATGAGTIRLTRVEDPLAAFAGALTGAFPPDHVERLRAEWE